MSARQDTRKRPDGSTYKRWTADVCYVKADGTELRARRDPRRNTRASAEKLEREILAMMEAGTWGQKPKDEVPTLAGFERRFIDTYAKQNNKPSVVAEKERMFKYHFGPLLGLSLDEITGEVIEDWKSKQEGEPKSVNNRIAVLSRALNVAEEWGLIAKAPTIRTVEQPDAAFDFLEFDEAKALVSACDRPKLRTAVLGILNAGYRNGEVRVLQWPDLDLERGVSTVRRNDWQGELGTPKHGRTRHVPINGVWREAIEAWRHRRTLWVFDGGHPDGYMTEREEITPLHTACRRAGIREIGWHVLRHTFASHLVMRGVDLYTVSHLLGHRSIKTTQRYAHLAPTHTAAAVEALAGRQLGGKVEDVKPEALGI